MLKTAAGSLAAGLGDQHGVLTLKRCYELAYEFCYDCNHCLIAVFIQKSSCRGGAENTVSASNIHCNMQNQAVDEGQSKISRSALLAGVSCSESVTSWQALLLCPTL